MTSQEEQLLLKEKMQLQKRLLEIDKLLHANLDQLLEMINKKHRWNIREKSRLKEIVTARNEFYYLAREKKFTFQEIGDFLGFHHATVIHGINTHKKTLRKLKGK